MLWNLHVLKFMRDLPVNRPVNTVTSNTHANCCNLEIFNGYGYSLNVMQLTFWTDRISVDGKVPYGEVLIHRFECVSCIV